MRCEMWKMSWLIGRAPDFQDQGPGFEPGNSCTMILDPDALQDHCVKMQKISGERGKPTLETKMIFKKY